MNCTESATNVTLHAADLVIQNDTLHIMEKDGNDVDISNIVYDLDREFFIINLRTSLVAGKTYVVRIHYMAKLNDNLKGFYRSAYRDHITEKEEYLAVTQFEATEARRAFPCFDEPQLKAKFTMTITHDKKLTAFFNMPVREQTEVRGRPDRVGE